MADLVPFAPPSDPAEAQAPELEWNSALWTSAINEARQDAKELVTKGKKNVEAYLGYDTLDHEKGQPFACPPNDFMFASQKIALLYYKTPDVHLKAEEENARMRAPLFAAVLNQRILPKAHVQDLMDRMLLDVVLPAGLSACKIGYEGHDEPMTAPGVDPLTGQPTGQMQPVLDPTTGQPQMRTISEKFYADKIPVGRFLFPVDSSAAVFTRPRGSATISTSWCPKASPVASTPKTKTNSCKSAGGGRRGGPRKRRNA